MSDNDDQMLRELERALDSALDEESISEMLDAYQPTKQASEARDAGADGVLGRDSEALIGAAPSSEASEEPPTLETPLVEPPTIEAYVGEAPDDEMPDAAVVMRRQRQDAGRFPAQPPPIPGSLSSKKQPPPKPPPSTRASRSSRSSQKASTARDLRPADESAERSWNLDETTLDEVLLELVSEPGRGLVEVRTDRQRAQLVIEDGQLFDIRLLPASPKRSLSAFLQRADKLTAEQAAQIRRRAERDGVSEAHLLLQEPGLVSAGVVRSALYSRTRYLMRRLLDAPLSHAEYNSLADTAASMIVSVPLASILFSHARAAHSAKYSGKRQRARQRFRHMRLSRRACFAFSLNQFGLELHERQLIDRVLGEERAFEQVLARSPLPDDATIALLAALEAVGLLEVKPPGLSENASSSWAEDYAAAHERIELLEGRLDRENLFAVFGLHWTSYDAEIARGYREMSSIFEAANQPLGLSEAERDRVDRLQDRLDAIYERLIDPEQRELYRRKLISTANRARTIKKLELLAAAALRKKKLDSALDYYRRLVEIAPQHERARKLLPVLIARTNRRG
ncbi:MAG: hypothetical protein ACLFVJ_23180 [Persicimonas sp.]